MIVKLLKKAAMKKAATVGGQTRKERVKGPWLLEKYAIPNVRIGPPVTKGIIEPFEDIDTAKAESKDSKKKPVRFIFFFHN
ncbi:hypothetical protein PTKIN_Ptkin11bG0111700 [Pterospermum kingtungense]